MNHDSLYYFLSLAAGTIMIGWLLFVTFETRRVSLPGGFSRCRPECGWNLVGAFSG
jgi:hypothetical protein